MLLAVGVALALVTVTVASAAPRPEVLKAGNPSGIVFAHGNGKGHGPPIGHGSNPDLVYHNGPVMHGTAATPIYWGNSWSSSDVKVSDLATFYGGVGGSSYLGTTTEYSDAAGKVSSNVSLTGSYFDSSSTSRKAPSTSDVLNVVADTLAAHGQDPVANGYYPVYSDQPRGHASYCAWHSWGLLTNSSGQTVEVQFAFFFNLDNDPGCDISGYPSWLSQGAAALANVSGHELSETLTDRHGDAWYDSSGAENADKCAWTFGAGYLKFGGEQWKIQGNWSNSSHDTGSPASYDGSGCIDGTNTTAGSG